MKFRTRFAPSPTGNMHFGSARAALLPYIFSLKNNGEFFLRIDDTDEKRSKQEYVDQIKKDLKWMGINWKFEFTQSSRKERYEEIFELLKNNNYIYPCFATEESLEQVRLLKSKLKKAPIITREDCTKQETDKSHWRMELKDTDYSLKDIIHKDLKFKRNWSDPVIKREDGSFCYIFTSIIDDLDYKVTHIIRGEEHISNGAVQNYMLKVISSLLSINHEIIWAHFPLFLDEKGAKLSKRENSLDLQTLKDQGIEKWTLWSFLTQVGSSNKILISNNLESYVNSFFLENFSSTPKKLFLKELWERNRKIIQCLEFHNIKDRFLDFPKFDKEAWELLKYNFNTLAEIKKAYENMINYYEKNGLIEENKNLKEIYEEIFHSSYGPKISDIKKYFKIEQ